MWLVSYDIRPLQVVIWFLVHRTHPLSVYLHAACALSSKVGGVVCTLWLTVYWHKICQPACYLEGSPDQKQDYNLEWPYLFVWLVSYEMILSLPYELTEQTARSRHVQHRDRLVHS